MSNWLSNERVLMASLFSAYFQQWVQNFFGTHPFSSHHLITAVCSPNVSPDIFTEKHSPISCAHRKYGFRDFYSQHSCTFGSCRFCLTDTISKGFRRRFKYPKISVKFLSILPLSSFGQGNLKPCLVLLAAGTVEYTDCTSAEGLKAPTIW